MTDTNNNRDKARAVFWRFHEVYQRGHADWIKHVRRLEDYYLGGGRQWRQEDRDFLESKGRPAREVNTIMPTINAAAGYQMANRVDISYLPKGGEADEDGAKTISKVIKHAMDNTGYRYAETDVFLDGLIQQRGYFDIRMSYEDNVQGEPKITVLDPMDVLPDPDAKHYDPDEWSDVRTTRWLTAREIEGIYGKDASDAVVSASVSYCNEDNWGSEHVDRAGFGEMPPSYGMSRGWYEDSAHVRRYRIIDQQTHEYATSLCAVWPGGEVRVVEDLPREHLAWLIDRGVAVLKRRVRRVRWEVCAPEVCFLDRLSPYSHFTVVPYFPYFRRGRTVGMVDNMTSPTDMLNKFVSQFEHVVNGSANSGWQGEAGALENMSDDEFTANGSQTGLVLLRKPGTAPFQKIEPNQVPTGIDRMITFAHDHLNVVSGVDEQLRNPGKRDMSGVAIQALQYAAQQKLAIALDNLARTRHMVAKRMLDLTQRFMGAERIIRITETDHFGIERRVPMALNVRQPDGTILNDLTIGEYDIVVNERPINVTFDNSEFEQLKQMRVDMGLPIPDATIVRASSLADKAEIAEAMRESAGKPDPRAEAEAVLTQAKAKLAEAQTVGENLKALYASIQTAQAIVVTPQAAALADALARSAGFVDQDAAPIVPSAPEGMPGVAMPMTQAIPQNTHPLSPANPEIGMLSGLTDAPTQP